MEDLTMLGNSNQIANFSTPNNKEKPKRRPSTRVYIRKTEVTDPELLSHVGEKYNRLTIISAIRKEDCNRLRNYYHCKCDCGNFADVRCESVLNGSSKSCGCYGRDVAREVCIKRNTTHGLSKTRLHTIWADMKARCYNPKSNRYYIYGARGIRICDEWLSYDHENKINTGFLNFYSWANENGYRDDLSIDRIDVNGDYEPSNCKWSTRNEQSWNKTNNVFITLEQNFDDIGMPPVRYTLPLASWSKITGISLATLRKRLIDTDKRWSVTQALTTPTTAMNRFRYNGVPMIINIGEYMDYNRPDMYDRSIHD